MISNVFICTYLVMLIYTALKMNNSMIILYELISCFHASHCIQPQIMTRKIPFVQNNGIASAQVSWGHVFSASKPCNTNMILRLQLIGCSKALSASDCGWDCCPICDSLSSHQGGYLLQIFLETETYSLNSTFYVRCLNIVHRRLQKTILCN